MSGAGLQPGTSVAASAAGAISSAVESLAAVTADTEFPGEVSGEASARATWARRTGTIMATTRAGRLSMFGHGQAGNGSAYGSAAERVMTTERRERACARAQHHSHDRRGRSWRMRPLV
jgi:hypothetical protein